MYYSKRHGEHYIDLTVVVELISLQKELSKHFTTMSYSQKMPLHYRQGNRQFPTGRNVKVISTLRNNFCVVDITYNGELLRQKS